MPWQAAACDPEATNHFVAAFEGAGPSQLFQPLAQWLGLPGLLALTFLFATAVQQARFSTGSPDNAAALAADVVGLHGLATYFEKRDGSGRASNVVVYKVLAENLPQLFLQTAFLSAAFARFDGWGRLKIMVSLGLGLISATLKLSQMAMAWISIMWREPETRGRGLFYLLVFALPGLLMVAWVVARIIMAHQCPSHQWNLATGCEPYEALRQHRATLRTAAATRLQSMARGRRQRQAFLLMCRGFLRLQARQRGVLARQQVRSWRRNKAATQLAAHLRTFGAVGRWRRVQRATLRLQSWQRGHTQRAQYQVEVARVLRLQRWWRSTKKRRRFGQLQQSVRKLQAVARGWHGRREATERRVQRFRLRRAVTRLVRLRRRHQREKAFRWKMMEMYRRVPDAPTAKSKDEAWRRRDWRDGENDDLIKEVLFLRQLCEERDTEIQDLQERPPAVAAVSGAQRHLAPADRVLEASHLLAFAGLPPAPMNRRGQTDVSGEDVAKMSDACGLGSDVSDLWDFPDAWHPRIALARAAYATEDLVLMDDPFVSFSKDEESPLFAHRSCVVTVGSAAPLPRPAPGRRFWLLEGGTMQEVSEPPDFLNNEAFRPQRALHTAPEPTSLVCGGKSSLQSERAGSIWGNALRFLSLAPGHSFLWLLVLFSDQLLQIAVDWWILTTAVMGPVSDTWLTEQVWLFIAVGVAMVHLLLKLSVAQLGARCYVACCLAQTKSHESRSEERAMDLHFPGQLWGLLAGFCTFLGFLSLSHLRLGLWALALLPLYLSRALTATSSHRARRLGAGPGAALEPLALGAAAGLLAGELVQLGDCLSALYTITALLLGSRFSALQAMLTLAPFGMLLHFVVPWTDALYQSEALAAPSEERGRFAAQSSKKMDGLVFTPSAAPHATRAPCAVHAALHGTPSVRPGAGGAAFGAVSGLVAALVASQMAKPRSVRPRRVKHVCMAVPTEKPMRTTVFTKAALDGVSPGDCPFTHGVLMALKLKGVDYDVVACSPTTKPPWLLQEVGGQMPCVVHQGVAHVESGKILKWIDQTFPGPTLAVPSELVSRAGLFAAIAEYTKNTDSSKDADLLVTLQMALTRFRMHLFSLPIGTQYACGNALTLADCEAWAKSTTTEPRLYLPSRKLAILRMWRSRAGQPREVEVCEAALACLRPRIFLSRK
eukprot:g1396.t1